jgi:hypothetical protein
MTTEQNIETYEVGFSTTDLQHIFYISCPDVADAKKFAHAVFHYYQTPEQWGQKLSVTAIAKIKAGNCLPDCLHIVLHGKQEVSMQEEDAKAHEIVRNIIREMIGDGYVPMAIYDNESVAMTVYATQRKELAPQAGGKSVITSFSQFGGNLNKNY